VLKNLNPETTYDLPSKAYDKSRDRNLVLNADKWKSFMNPESRVFQTFFD